MRRILLIASGAAGALVIATVAFAAGLAATGPGHALARRWALAALQGAVDGRVHIGSLGGSLWRAADLADVELATPDGRPVIRAARVRVRYALTDLARGRFILRSVELVRPTVALDQGADGRWNIERLFKLVGRRPGPSGRRPLVEIVGAHLTDGTVLLRERADSAGRRRQRSFLGLDLELGRLRASHPDSTAILGSVRRLAVRVTDPAITVTDAGGQVALDGDSLRFDLDHVELPGTRSRVSGLVRWGRGTSYEIHAGSRHVSFADLAGLVPGLPRTGGGSGTARVSGLADGGAEYDLSGLEVASGRSAASGALRVAVGPRGGVRIGAMDLDLEPLDLELLRPWQRDLPIRGLVRGRLRGAGALSDLEVDARLAFTDEAVAGRPTNTVSGRGRLAVGGPRQVVFKQLAVRRADLDLGTVRRLAPVVSLTGRLLATGRLDGAWTDATFEGTVRHYQPSLAASTARGKLHLALADTVRVDADLALDSLSFDLLARSYPAIPLRGMAAGSVTVHGPVTALAIEGRLAGPWGTAQARGTVGQRDSVVLVGAQGSVDSLDLHRHLTGVPPTLLTGHWGVELEVPLTDTASPTMGTVRVNLARSRVAGMRLDTAGVALSLGADRLVVDTGFAVQAGGALTAFGAIGRSGRPPGQLTVVFRADTLAGMVPLLRWFHNLSGDTTGEVALDGGGQARIVIVGTAAAWSAEGSLDLESVSYGDLAVRFLRAGGRLSRTAPGLRLDARAAAESLSALGYTYGPVTLEAAGREDSLSLRFNTGFALGGSARGALLVRRDTAGLDARVDSLALALPAGTWRLTGATRIAVTRDLLLVDSLVLAESDGAGAVRAHGALPRAGAGDFVLLADSVPLVDAYALAQLDTTGVGGTVDLALHVSGAGPSPLMEIRAALVNGRLGEFRAPRVEALAHYADRRLAIKGGLWRDTVRVVAATGSLPLDLAFTSVPHRRLPDSLRIEAQADSVDLAVVDALTGLVRDVGGQLSASVRIGGTWDDPRLTGSAEIRRGAATVPALGARYTDIDTRLVLEGDRIRVERGRLKSSGTLDVSGEVRFESLSRPVLDLVLDASGFDAFSLRDFAGLTGSGRLLLKGPALGARLGGRLTVDAGFLAFADLVEKRIVNLDDPEFRAIVDSNLARAMNLGPAVEIVFLDSLRIDSLAVVMGPDVWLRSHESSIQLAGEFEVAKAVEEGVSRYRLDGTLRAERGTYRLQVGPTSKEFRVTRGAVRFFGTPDLNPELDIVAEHSLRTAQGSQIVVRALIGGTLLVPKLTLESDQRPPLSETEIVSYLLFGRPSFELVGQAGPRSEQRVLASAVAGLAAGQLEQTLVSDLGLPIDYLAIRPGAGSEGDVLGFGGTRVEAGAQIGERTFLTLNAGLCEVRRGATSQVVGATVQHRLTPRWSIEASIEPLVRECLPTGAVTLPSARYQFGADFLWQLGVP